MTIQIPSCSCEICSICWPFVETRLSNSRQPMFYMLHHSPRQARTSSKRTVKLTLRSRAAVRTPLTQMSAIIARSLSLVTMSRTSLPIRVRRRRRRASSRRLRQVRGHRSCEGPIGGAWGASWGPCVRMEMARSDVQCVNSLWNVLSDSSVRLTSEP